MPVQINSGVRLNDVGRLIVDIVGRAPNVSALYVTSGMDGDHGAKSHHYGNLTYQGSPTAATDGRGRDHHRGQPQHARLRQVGVRHVPW